ncbi:hypothetical protein [Alkaliphilus transvaalensis]|uniref:hypothetical protein n=1 Tax=Alkaliphilus transvaalensis TaxID=114628 RepID=UPI0005552A5A|nr:hypothetical protein [Alkaliphilus transvaalensis]
MFKKLLGPGLDEVWSQLAEEIGGEFIKGSFTKSSKLITKLKEWTIVLDTYTVSTGKSSIVYTRMRVPYVTTDGFHFKVYKKSIFSDIGKLFKMQDVVIGHEEFDEEFIIKANNEEQVRKLLSKDSIRFLINENPSITLEIQDKEEGLFVEKLPEKTRFLLFQEVGVIKDTERLKKLYLLASEVLNQLCEIGSALDDDPKITLKY